MLWVNCTAQNLVPNPSFEDTVACPIGMNQIENAACWINFRGSPEYLNSCDTTSIGTCNGAPYVGVPVSCFGNQCPANGNGYGGFIAYMTGWQNGREFFGTSLSNDLIIGQKYFVSFKVSLSDKSICGCNNLGILFSTIRFSLDTFSTSPLNNFAHVYNNIVIIDTINWTTIFGSFVADSAYKYIIIGNFFDDVNTDTIRFYPVTACTPYYFIDDICVSTDSITCNLPNGNNICDSGVFIFEPNTTPESFKIYPNPTNGRIIIEYTNSHSKCNLTITDIHGKIIKFYSNYSFGDEISLIEFTSGLYYIQITTNNKTIIQKLIIN